MARLPVFLAGLLLLSFCKTWVKLVNDFQKASLSTRLGIPLIYGIDAVHGHNNVYKATIFPHNVGLGATSKMICSRSGDVGTIG
ncbi:hypothetical protein PRUPE_7G007100 [Prunus persica]|uniref:Glycoside hydrolase family 3 N-terminal domain-containing protein n=1 Tax=Prunus persica TaxID=3760 RepID=A0A251N4K3_PRUPE|nr:hypothetical protein PRUPE_7G007100 [Prunus persica]